MAFLPYGIYHSRGHIRERECRASSLSGYPGRFPKLISKSHSRSPIPFGKLPSRRYICPFRNTEGYGEEIGETLISQHPSNLSRSLCILDLANDFLHLPPWGFPPRHSKPRMFSFFFSFPVFLEEPVRPSVRFSGAGPRVSVQNRGGGVVSDR